jgi:hypothetical protein
MANQMFTREELEDIWQNKPYGYFVNQVKAMKGKKKYKIKITAKKIVKEELGSIEGVVYAKDLSSATSGVQAVTLKSQLLRNLNLSSWSHNDIQFTYESV